MGFIGLRYGNCSSENINQEDMESGETLCHIPSDNKPHPLQLSFLPPRGISDMGASIKAQVEEGELNEIWSDFVRIDIDESKWECQFVIPIAVDGLQGKKVPFTINLADSTGRGVLYVEATFRVF